MNDPVTPLLLMEKKPKDKVIYDFMKEVEKPIVPEEVLSNPTRGQGKKIIRLIQPHNFRRYFTFSKEGYNPTQPYSEKNHKSEHHFKNFYGCHVIIRKKSAEVINLWHQKQWRLLEANSINDVNERIDTIKKEMEETTVKAIKKFIKLNGGKTDYIPIKKREATIGIHGDDYIDKIPPEMIIVDTHFDKVYREKLEFKGEESVKSYIRNRVVEDLAPDIAKEINNINEGIDKLTPVLKALTEQITLHFKVQKDTLKTNKEMRKTLKQIRSELSQKRLSDF